MYVCVYVCVCMYVRMSVCMYTHKHTHTHTHTGKTLSRAEQVEVAKLKQKANKAESKGDLVVAAQYQKDIARILGVQYRPPSPACTYTHTRIVHAGHLPVGAASTVSTEMCVRACVRACVCTHTNSERASEREELHQQRRCVIASGLASARCRCGRSWWTPAGRQRSVVVHRECLSRSCPALCGRESERWIHTHSNAHTRTHTGLGDAVTGVMGLWHA